MEMFVEYIKQRLWVCSAWPEYGSYQVHGTGCAQHDSRESASVGKWYPEINYPKIATPEEGCSFPFKFFLVGAFINKRARLLQSLVFLRETRSDER